MKRGLVLCLLFGLMLSLCGCFLEPAESLYAVPKQSESFYNLQSAIEKTIGENVVYSPPTAGENQQAVQLTDLDGDGEDEAIVFWKAETDMPLTLTVFDKQEGQFVPVAQASGAGNVFDHVQYVEIDDKAGNEIVVGRQLGEGVAQSLYVYALRDGELIEVLSASYAEFLTADLNNDGRRGVFLLHQDVDAQNGVAEYYHWLDGRMVREREANMSTGVSAVKRIITGKMCEGTAAVFVASAYGEGSIVTDVFGFRSGTFSNLTLVDGTDKGVKTVRDYYVYSCDIDTDGLIELPRLIAMPSLPEEASSENQSLILWYNLRIDGEEEEKLLTYHNYSGGWYLVVPEQWEKRFTVSQTTAFDGTPAYRFALTADDGAEELFSIAAASGERSGQMLAQSDWKILTQKGEVTYACLMEKQASRNNVTMDLLREMFHFIRVDWKNGETD